MVPLVWPGSTVVCVGSGPSALASDVSFARRAGAKILAVNSAFTLCDPQPDALFAADARWWAWHPEAVALSCLKYAFAPTAIQGVDTLEWSLGSGLDANPGRLRAGGHSGYAAINLAVHLGARCIILLGYDMAPTMNGQHHFHVEHPNGSHLNYGARRGVYQTLLAPMKELGITLVNASRRTAIPHIPRVGLAHALEQAVSA